MKQSYEKEIGGNENWASRAKFEKKNEEKSAQRQMKRSRIELNKKESAVTLGQVRKRFLTKRSNISSVTQNLHVFFLLLFFFSLAHCNGGFNEQVQTFELIFIVTKS